MTVTARRVSGNKKPQGLSSLSPGIQEVGKRGGSVLTSEGTPLMESGFLRPSLHTGSSIALTAEASR
jgi:hypothetical protein